MLHWCKMNSGWKILVLVSHKASYANLQTSYNWNNGINHTAVVLCCVVFYCIALDCIIALYCIHSNYILYHSSSILREARYKKMNIISAAFASFYFVLCHDVIFFLTSSQHILSLWQFPTTSKSCDMTVVVLPIGHRNPISKRANLATVNHTTIQMLLEDMFNTQWGVFFKKHTDICKY